MGFRVPCSNVISILRKPKLDNMWDIMDNICERTQDNLWGLYRKYFWEPKLGNNMENIWVICGKYVGNIYMGPK